MKIKIRKAKKGDFKNIQKLNYLLFKKENNNYDPTLNTNWPFSEEGNAYFKKVIIDENCCALVATINEYIVGYLIGQLKIIDNSRIIKKRAVLQNMYIQKKYRNRGIGANLVEEFIKWAKKCQVENIRVIAFTKNIEAIKFYKKMGFYDYNHTMEITL